MQLISREEARSLGVTRYFAGLACKNGHVAERRVRDGQCMDCVRASNHRKRSDPAYRAQERVKNRDRMRNRYATDPAHAERMRQRSRANNRKVQQDPALRSRANEYQRNYVRERRATVPAFRIARAARSRVRNALQGVGAKSARTLDLLGVPSMEFYKAYLEAQFLPGMTWENYGAVWEIDHITLLCSYGDALAEPAVQREAFHYLNTRPLWVAANRSRKFNKHAALDKPVFNAYNWGE